jgi:hypothetical protein
MVVVLDSAKSQPLYSLEGDPILIAQEAENSNVYCI